MSEAPKPPIPDIMPGSFQLRFRVELVGEKSEEWKDSGVTFRDTEQAEKWCKDFVPENMNWRILIETFGVVKFREYQPPYIT